MHSMVIKKAVLCPIRLENISYGGHSQGIGKRWRGDLAAKRVLSSKVNLWYDNLRRINPSISYQGVGDSVRCNPLISHDSLSACRHNHFFIPEFIIAEGLRCTTCKVDSSYRYTGVAHETLTRKTFPRPTVAATIRLKTSFYISTSSLFIGY